MKYFLITLLVLTNYLVYESNSFSEEPCECGIENLSTRIINGKPVDYERYPWFIQLNGCGGALITDKHVVTSAHCIFPETDRPTIKPVLGLYNFSDYKSSPYLEVEEFIPHPEYIYIPDALIAHYSSEHFWYDIAIIKLKKRLEFKDGLCPICLSNFDKTDNLFAYGFGAQNKGNQLVLAKFMHEVNLNRIGMKTCRSFFAGKNAFNETNTICTLNHDMKHSLCAGDSGTPVSTRKDGRVYLSGIPFYADKQCGADGFIHPNLLEKVFAHLDWIRSETKTGFYCYGEHHPFEPGFHPEYKAVLEKIGPVDDIFYDAEDWYRSPLVF